MSADSAFSRLLCFCPTVAEFIEDPKVSEVEINPDGRIFVEKGGVTNPFALDAQDGEAEELCKQAARFMGRDISDRSPLLSMRMVDGSRISMACPPVSPGWCLTIRKFGDRRFRLDDLIQSRAVTPKLAVILRSIVADRKNTLISGGTGSGKTTLLSALIMEVPGSERIVLIEDASEIYCNHPNVVRFEAWAGSEHSSPVTIRELLKHSLRFTPTRLIIGEVRDVAAYDLLQALNTGHGGSFSTVHSETAVGALERISSLAVSSHPNLDHAFIREETANAFHFVVHVARSLTGERYVEEVIKVAGYSRADKKFVTEQIYKRES